MGEKNKMSELSKINIGITLVFCLVVTVFVVSLLKYWDDILDPRLKMAAEMHAQTLSLSQADVIARTLEIEDPTKRQDAYNDVIDTILLMPDPSIGEPFFQSVSMQIDYEVVPAKKGSLDVAKGDFECPQCIQVEVAVMGSTQQMLAVAKFDINDGYYRMFSDDMRSRFYNQSYFTFGMFVVVWLMMVVLFYRLNKVKENIEFSDRAKTRFMANVSHELRTPLNAILGYTQLYKKDKALMAEHAQGVETIHRSAEHLLLLINDILDFSKVDSEGVHLYPKEVALSDFLNAIVEMIEIRATLKDINFVFDSPKDLPQLVLADEKRLRQILLNLLNNAVKFTEAGQVTFVVKIFPSSGNEQDDLIGFEFKILDTGIGIPKDKLEKIFVPYQQVENQITRAEGSGLGLSISKNLIELMGSELVVTSTLGEGSCFTFCIDLPVINYDRKESKAFSGVVIGYEGPRKHILSIDDNDYNRDILRQQLAQYGFLVTDACDGTSGLAALEENQPDLVLLDILMPDMSGYEVVKKIRSDSCYSALPVIATTAVTQKNAESLARDAGFSDLLTKPVIERELLEILQSHLGLEWLYETSEKDDVGRPLQKKSIEEISALPELGDLNTLAEHAKKHNILAIKELIAEFEQTGDYQEFIALVKPIVLNYQFEKLASLLEKVKS